MSTMHKWTVPTRQGTFFNMSNTVWLKKTSNKAEEAKTKGKKQQLGSIRLCRKKREGKLSAHKPRKRHYWGTRRGLVS